MSIQTKVMLAVSLAMALMFYASLAFSAQSELHIKATIVQCGNAEQTRRECRQGDSRCCVVVPYADINEQRVFPQGVELSYEVLVEPDGTQHPMVTINAY